MDLAESGTADIIPFLTFLELHRVEKLKLFGGAERLMVFRGSMLGVVVELMNCRTEELFNWGIEGGSITNFQWSMSNFQGFFNDQCSMGNEQFSSSRFDVRSSRLLSN